MKKIPLITILFTLLANVPIQNTFAAALTADSTSSIDVETTVSEIGLDFESGVDVGPTDSSAPETTNISSENIQVSSEDTSLESVELVVKREDVEKDEMASEGAGIHPQEISSREELKKYVFGAMQTDENLRKVEFEKERVKVSYKHLGRLLGIVPMPITITAETDAKGEIYLKYPWYLLITVDDQSELREDLSNEVRGIVQVSEDKELSLKEQADLASRMYLTLRGNFETVTTKDEQSVPAD